MRSVKVKLYIVVPLLVVAVAVAVVVVLATISPSSDEVLHAIVKRSGDPEGKSFYTVEIWVDEAIGDSRAIFRDENGNRTGDILISGKEKFESYNLGPAPATQFIAADTQDEMLRSVEQQLWRYKWLLEKGEAVVIGKEVVNERRVLKVEVRLPSAEDEKIVAIVDEETKLPYLETVYREGKEAESIRSTYEVIEMLPRSSLPAGTFEREVSQDVHRTIQKMSLEQAKNFAEFDLYYLGEEFDGLQIQSIQYYRSYRVFRVSPPAQNKVTIVYGAPGWIPEAGDMPETYVTIESATADEINEWQQHGREVKDGILRPTTRGDYMKELLRGQSLVTLWSRTEAEVRDMESVLQRLN